MASQQGHNTLLPVGLYIWNASGYKTLFVYPFFDMARHWGENAPFFNMARQ